MIIEEMMKAFLSANLKMFSEDEDGERERETWVTDIDSLLNGYVRIVIEAPEAEALLWVAANARIAAEEFMHPAEYQALVEDKNWEEEYEECECESEEEEWEEEDEEEDDEDWDDEDDE